MVLCKLLKNNKVSEETARQSYLSSTISVITPEGGKLRDDNKSSATQCRSFSGRLARLLSKGNDTLPSSTTCY